MSYGIIDSHVHLWPESASSPDGHAWMAAVPSLAKEHDLGRYRDAARDDSQTHHNPRIIYIETDRRYIFNSDERLETWAYGPLEEIKYLRSLVEGSPADAETLAGLVPWAPVDRGESTFDQWLDLAQTTAGPQTWKKVKGFRFLLQAIHSKSEFEALVFSRDFLNIMVKLGELGLAFDVGIDQHRGGTWQLEAWDEVLRRLEESKPRAKTRFIMNFTDHLCKPDMILNRSCEDVAASAKFQAWQQLMLSYARRPNVYMKLSGAFSELSEGKVETASVEKLVARVLPWTEVILDAFGPQRVMFGSDWPVCNIRGPAGEASWPFWKAVVVRTCQQRNMSDQDIHGIFRDAAIEAYGLDIL